MTLSSQITSIAATSIAAGVLAATGLMWEISRVNASYAQLLDLTGQQDALRRIQVTFKKQVQEWKDILIRGSDPVARQTYRQQFDADDQRVDQLAQTLLRSGNAELGAGINAFITAHGELDGNYAKALAVFLASDGRDIAAADAMVKGQDRPPTDAIDKLVDETVQRVDAAREEQTTRIHQVVLRLMLTLGVAFTAIGVGAQLTVRRLVRTLRTIIVTIGAGADQVVSAASQLSASSQSLSQGASDQAAAVEETSASREQVNAMAGQNSESARQAADLMGELQNNVAQAAAALGQMQLAIDDINAQTDRISKIIKVIDEIAFQTNILALNAAVEAARAGEAGLGFAVVADEVRNLARRCAEAAKDTAQLIGDSEVKARHGKKRVEEVAGGIRTMTDRSEKVKRLLDQVSDGGAEQAQGVAQIGRAMAQIEAVTQRAAASAEEGAAAAEELNSQANALQEIVATLSALVGRPGTIEATAPVAEPAARSQPERGRSSAAPSTARSASNGVTENATELLLGR